MNIVEYFDEYNIDHLKAFTSIVEKGVWPEGFIPEGIEFPPQWQLSLISKMALAWHTAAMKGQIVGIPHPDQ